MTNSRSGERGTLTYRRTTDTVPPSRWAGARALALALLAFAAAAALIVVWPGARAAYDSGLAGRLGTFTATRCWTTGSGKNVNDWCTGTFTAQDGSTVRRDQTLRNTPAAMGRPLEVSLQPDGGYAVRRVSHVMFDLAGCLGLLGMAAGSLVLIGDAPRKRMGSKQLYRRQPWLGLALTSIVGFPLLMALAVLTLVAAVITIMVGS